VRRGARRARNAVCARLSVLAARSRPRPARARQQPPKPIMLPFQRVQPPLPRMCTRVASSLLPHLGHKATTFLSPLLRLQCLPSSFPKHSFILVFFAATKSFCLCSPPTHQPIRAAAPKNNDSTTDQRLGGAGCFHLCAPQQQHNTHKPARAPHLRILLFQEPPPPLCPLFF
jgi:hypothetical protein